MAFKDILSSYRGIRSKIENIKKSTYDELTDISDEEKRDLIELSNYHLNAEYVVSKINERRARSKEERKELTREIGFKDLKVLDRITEENVDRFPKGFQERYYEVKGKGIYYKKKLVGNKWYTQEKIFTDNENITQEGIIEGDKSIHKLYLNGILKDVYERREKELPKEYQFLKSY